MTTLTIHATNITGLGACQVVSSFLRGLESLDTKYSSIECYLPYSGPLSNYYSNSPKFKIIKFRRYGPKFLSRLLECIFPNYFFKLGDDLIVLGDVPLRTSSRQLVLIQQAHLQKPGVNSFVDRSIVFRGMRALTKINARFADNIIVQTNAMKTGLEKSYPDWLKRNCVKVIGHPPPDWFLVERRKEKLQDDSKGLRLFYPAVGYTHKNHTIITNLESHSLIDMRDQFILTLPKPKNKNVPSWINYVGELSQNDCLLEFQKADALIFPSLLESFGLPLVEAMVMGIPIIAADLPYARALCGRTALYFDPKSPQSMIETIMVLKDKINSGWTPDWSTNLSTMPDNWGSVVQKFLRLL
jgi:glycosyltransferase involved in cell wall biosynthesis